MTKSKWKVVAAASFAVAGVTWLAAPVEVGADDNANKTSAAAANQVDKTAKAGDDAKGKDTAKTAGVAQADAKDAQGADAQKKGPVLIGVVTLIPIPVADVDLPKGVNFDNNIPDAPDMRDTLAEVTEAAFTREGFNDLVERLVDMDRNRVGEFAEKKFETLDGRIAQLQKAWKDKYGVDFDIREAKAYAPLAFAQGRITNAEAFANSWPVDPSTGDKARPAGATVVTDRVRDQGNIEAGREVAIVRLPAEFGLPALNVSFIDEAFGWKIDVPNKLSGQQLHDNLLTHLTYLGEHVDKWPKDVNDAYRCATHHVLMAAYGLDVPSAESKGQKG